MRSPMQSKEPDRCGAYVSESFDGSGGVKNDKTGDEDSAGAGKGL